MRQTGLKKKEKGETVRGQIRSSKTREQEGEKNPWKTEKNEGGK